VSEIHRPIPGTLSETGLQLPDNLPFGEWMRVGETLKRMTKSVQWWVGDWLAFGEASYGEEAFQAVERADKTFANWATVCRKVDPSRRREDVNFSVHAVLAPLPPDEQEHMLERAASEGWTEGKAREETGRKPKNVEVITELVCPACGEVSPLSAVETRERQNG
jgi:hypothetical protein